MIPLRAALLPLLLAAAPAAAAQGFTVHGPDSSRITFGGRVHTLFDTSSEEGVPATATTLRRVRLEAAVSVTPYLSARIQPEYAGSVSLRDAFVRLDLHPAAALLMGQAQRQVGTIAPTSSNRVLPVERGVRIRGVIAGLDHYNLLSSLGYVDRDVGIQLQGTLPAAGGLQYAVGLFQGPARIVAPTENTHQLAARLAVRPTSAARAGLSWSRRDFARGDGSDAISVRGGSVVVADLELGEPRGGVRLLLEGAYGDFDPFVGTRFASAQGWVAYRTGRVSKGIAAVEPLFRVSWADPAARGPEPPAARGGTLLTPGVNLWLGGMNRLAVNWDLWRPDGGDGAHGGKLFFQVAF